MPGSMPATSQLDWLSSMTAMIVLFWSRAMRDLLKSFGWGIAGTPSIRYSDEVAIPRRPPHSVYRSPSRDCRRSERGTSGRSPITPGCGSAHHGQGWHRVTEQRRDDDGRDTPARCGKPKPGVESRPYAAEPGLTPLRRSDPSIQAVERPLPAHLCYLSAVCSDPAELRTKCLTRRACQ